MDGNDSNVAATRTTSRDRVHTFLTRVIQIIAVLAPVAYVCGHAHHTARLRGLGLDGSLVSLTFEGYVREGFVALINAFVLVFDALAQQSSWMLLVLSAAVVVVAVTFAYARLSRRGRGRLAAVARRSRNALEVSPGFRLALKTMSASLLLSFLPQFLLAVMFFFILPAVVAERLGSRDAETTWQQVRGISHQPRAFPTIVLPGPAGNQEAKLIECSDLWCIVFDGTRFNALPRDDIARIKGAEFR